MRTSFSRLICSNGLAKTRQSNGRGQGMRLQIIRETGLRFTCSCAIGGRLQLVRERLLSIVVKSPFWIGRARSQLSCGGDCDTSCPKACKTDLVRLVPIKRVEYHALFRSRVEHYLGHSSYKRRDDNG